MRIAALTQYGLPPALIPVLEHRFGADLLEVQSRAVAEHGLLEGRSLVVCAPTGSGKTLIGELAALRAATHGRRGIILVPTRSLAEEKWHDLSAAYEPLGLRCLLSTGDRRTTDRDVIRGAFSLAVTVPEKLLALLAAGPSRWLEGAALVVDELQLLADPGRGAALEDLLTRLRARGVPEQVVGLSAVLRGADGLAEWLGAEVVRGAMRPVELRKGVLGDGVFYYREHNSGLWGEERLVPEGWQGGLDELDTGDGKRQDLLTCALSLASSGESVLLFVREKAECFATADTLARALPRVDDAGFLGDLERAEASAAAGLLARTAPHGVGFHNADMTFELRFLVERWAREGRLRVVCATSTLAMGVNLPMDNVLIDLGRSPSEGGCVAIPPLTAADVENMGGRAGRPGPGAAGRYGRCILASTSVLERERLLAEYVESRPGPALPTLTGDALAVAVGRLIGQQGPMAEAEVIRVYAGSWSCASGLCSEGDVAAAVADLRDRGLVTGDSTALRGSAALRAAARWGIPPTTAMSLAGLAADLVESMGPELEVLLGLAAAGLEAVPLPFPRFGLDPGEWDRAYQGRLVAEGFEEPGDLSPLAMLSAPELALAQRVALAAADWIGEEPTAVIEQRHRALGGAVERLCRDLARLAQACAELPPEPGPAAQGVSRHLRELSARLTSGGNAAASELAELSVAGVGRDHLRDLVAMGVTTPQDVRAAGIDALAEAMPVPVAEALWRAAGAYLARRRRATPFDGAVSRAPSAGKVAPAAAADAAWLVLDPSRRRVTVRAQPVRLTRPQFALLLRLAGSPGVVISYAELARALPFRDPSDAQRVRDQKSQLVRALRRASAPDGLPPVIETVAGRGLKWVADPRGVRIEDGGA
ncbi:MAG TPA: DEAD/DEAH box helicase [Armatimonadota bacterium]|nr:DEAD/DEAH box helicase [Armatimonadota bacterium]